MKNFHKLPQGRKYCQWPDGIDCIHHTCSQDGARFCEKHQIWLDVVWLAEYHAEGLVAEQCKNGEKNESRKTK